MVTDPNKSNADNVGRKASRHFRNKNKKYLKAKIEELETNLEIGDLYRGNIEVKKGYQPRTNILRDGKGDLVTDSQSILAGWRNHFSQILMYLWLMMLGIQKYIRRSHYWMIPLSVSWKWLLKG